MMNTKDYHIGIQLLISAANSTTQSPEEQFDKAYHAGKIEEAKTYLSAINVNYKRGHFLISAAQKNDVEMVKALLKKEPTEGILDALREAAFSGYVQSIQPFIDWGVVNKIEHASLKHVINYGSNRRAKEFFACHPHTQAFFTKEKLTVIQKSSNSSAVSSSDQGKVDESIRSVTHLANQT
jgi:hypothetical protein